MVSQDLSPVSLNLLNLILLEDMEGEILGKGASKTVYKAFDEYEGIEVAWNQVKLYDFLQRPEDLERLYREIHLLKTLNHENIMKFCTSWVDVSNRNINFVTEMFTSGTLRQYRLKHRRVNVRAVKHWCRQILKGLLYLHSHDPPVIHRDLKCDNIFINGNQGQVKIGDLGLAAVLRKSHAVRCVGTPEFMAPEVYEEEYNELVDIYAFGMCILEMVTFEYPYSECSHPAQIYKKVISGTKPEALYKVEDPEVRQFVDKCLASVSVRLSAEELLKDPFLQIHDYETGLELLQCQEFSDVSPPGAGLINGYSNYISYEPRSEPENHGSELEINGIDLFTSQEDEHLENLEIAIKGRRREDDGIFLRLRIADKEDHIRNIYFPFDIEVDTALSVATEMIAELDIADHDVLKIAGMIDGEITTLVPEWKRGKGEQEISDCTSESLCANCASRGYLLDYVSSNSPGAEHLQVLQCSKLGCAAIHGRFEEITYQVEGQEQSVDKDCTPSADPKQSSRINYADIWALRDPPESSPHGGRDPHYPEGMKEQSASDKEDKIINVDVLSECAGANSIPSSPTDDYENEIRQELRWLKAKYQLQLRELRDHQLGVKSRSPTLSPGSNYTEHKLDNRVLSFPFESPEAKFRNPEGLKLQPTVKCFTSDAHTRRSQAFSSTQMLTAKSFYSGVLLPHSLHRATSLPVDAIDF